MDKKIFWILVALVVVVSGVLLWIYTKPTADAPIVDQGARSAAPAVSPIAGQPATVPPDIAADLDAAAVGDVSQDFGEIDQDLQGL